MHPIARLDSFRADLRQRGPLKGQNRGASGANRQGLGLSRKPSQVNNLATSRARDPSP